MTGDNAEFHDLGFASSRHIWFPSSSSTPDGFHRRMNSLFCRIQYSLCWLICLCAVFPTQSVGQSGGGPQPPTPKKRLTPEERREKELEKQKSELEAEEQRLGSFGVVPEDDSTPLAKDYRKAVQDFRTSVAEYADAHARMELLIVGADVVELRDRWFDKLKKSQENLFVLRRAATDLVLSDPVRYENVALMLRDMLNSDLNADRSERWAPAAHAVLACEKLVTDEVLLNAGQAGLIDGDWDLVTNCWTKLSEQGKLPQLQQFLLSQISELRTHWEAELERRKEDEGKNNPRVEIITTKGVIEVELFEDDAPETVSSFIYLVESGYYSRMPFFLVRRHLLAQTGCEKGDGKGTAGYSIRFEGDSPTARRHFRGSLAIPLGVDPETQIHNTETGGSQFYISFAPLPFLDARHTVFGRIVKNSEFLGLIKEIDMTDEEERKKGEFRPDGIISAKVLRKRDHEYRPTPLLGKLPR